MKSTTCIVEIANQKNEKCLSEGEIHLLACPCLLTSCQLGNFLHEFTGKCFAVFDQSSCTIYLTWYWPLLFVWEFSSIIPFVVWLQDSSQIKARGYIFKSSIISKRFVEVFFFSWKLNISSFIFLIWMEQFWLWFRWKLTKTIRISIIFKSFCYFTPCMAFESWFRSINE